MQMSSSSERGGVGAPPTPPPPPPPAAVSDEEIASALHSLLRETNPNATFSSINAVVHHLQSRLGLDLSHKVDFIRHHIQLLFRSPPPPPPPHQLFNHQQNLSFYTATKAETYIPDFGFRSQVPTQPELYVKTPGRYVEAEPRVVAAAEAPKESPQTGKKRRGGPGGLNKLCGVTPELQAIVGQPALPRTEIVKQLWVYIRKHNLQDPSNKRKIICNDELRVVFETDCTDMFKMNKLLAKHIIPLEPNKAVVRSSKKPKVAEESGQKSAESDPIVIISDALANLLGISGREMPQSEASRHVWEYAKVNQLEDPTNSMLILCDEKLQELLGCASISAMAVPEMLARLHLLKR